MDLERLKTGLSPVLQNQKLIAFLISGLIIGSAVTFLWINQDVKRPGQVGEEIKQVLSEQTGRNLELVSVERESKMYRINLKDQQNQLVTVYATLDGEKFSTGLVDTEQLAASLEARNRFTNCLENKSVIMYGNLSQRSTQAQIQLLGGTQTVQPIYRDVSNNQTLREAVQAGVKRVPAFVYNNSVLQGVKTVENIENFTGCSYGGN
ncbi:MAG: hypothetical protein ABEJ83_02820 [Candidatus Nanohaloarchaea archaeon]